MQGAAGCYHSNSQLLGEGVGRAEICKSGDLPGKNNNVGEGKVPSKKFNFLWRGLFFVL